MKKIASLFLLLFTIVGAYAQNPCNTPELKVRDGRNAINPAGNGIPATITIDLIKPKDCTFDGSLVIKGFTIYLVRGGSVLWQNSYYHGYLPTDSFATKAKPGDKVVVHVTDWAAVKRTDNTITHMQAAVKPFSWVVK